jgi:NADH-quinone oxidoreductase subunit H
MRSVDGAFVAMKDFALSVAGAWVPVQLIPLLSALISAGAVMALLPPVMMYLTWLERKVIARMQDRIGPNRVGPFGLIQPVADGIKMFLKEDVVPEGADPVVHFLAPVLTVVPVFMLFLVIPFGRDMVAADLNVGILFFLGVSSMQTPMIIAAGWGTRSKFPALGAMRSAAQILAYEVPMVMVLVASVMSAGTMATSGIVAAQAGHWNILEPWGIFGFLVFFVAATAEANRTPFDMAEAESELVAGFHTEYSGLKFALFQMAEYLSGFASSALAVTVFLGGWNGPAILPSWAWFAGKTCVVFGILIWFRGTLPRFRIDQLMGLAWKLLFPLSLAVMAAAALSRVAPGLGGRLAGLALLVASYGLFSAVLLAEYERMNRPRPAGGRTAGVA